MCAAGLGHFVNPEPFVSIVPDWLPEPRLLVAVSGVLEVLGGIGILLPRTRRFAAWGLVALFIAVFPANVHMAIHQIPAFGPVPAWVPWARLPLQGVFVAWAAWVARGNQVSRS
jgi:uncharacterized membrane protein